MVILSIKSNKTVNFFSNSTYTLQDSPNLREMARVSSIFQDILLKFYQSIADYEHN